MRAIEKELVGQQFDALLESLTEEGPFIVQSDGKDVVVVLSPEDYEALRGGSSSSRNAAEPGFPLSREWRRG
jgi:hypothetical protein